MVSTAQRLGEFASGLARREIDPPLADKLALHLFDSLGALIAGFGVTDIRAIAGIPASRRGPGETAQAPLPPAWLCAAAIRCTEIDDIHLAACVTPSAAIVPVLFDRTVRQDEAPGGRLLGAYLSGLEIMIRFARAAGGPRLMGRGMWPSRLAAGMGAAACASALLSLGTEPTAHALAIAAAMAGGLSPRGAVPSSRWLIFGRAVCDGLRAALAAKNGVKGEPGLLDGTWSETTGIALDPALLVAGDAKELLTRDLGLKPWCAARQTMAAIAGFSDLLGRHDLDAGALTGVLVEVPPEYAAMIDHDGLPKARPATFANLRYLLGLAAFAPDGLGDVRRDDLRLDSRFETLAGLVRIEATDAFSAVYPARWPARVTVETASGARHALDVTDVPGDAATPLDWQAVVGKISAATGLPPGRLSALSGACRALPAGGDGREVETALAPLLATVDGGCWRIIR